MSELFSILNSINLTKKNLLESGTPEKEYIPFIINKSLSYFSDTLLHCNEINKRPFIPKKYQYIYYLNSIRARKRFSKWFKKDKNKNIEAIKEYYNVSDKRAQEYANMLNKQQIEQILTYLDKGGVD